MTEQNRDELEDLLNEAIKATDRGALLTQRLLAYSRTQALDPQTIDINLLIEDSIFLMERTIGENISVIFKQEKDIWPCAIDKSQMENALLNLAINARDAMPKGGNITIKTANVTLKSTDHYGELEPGNYIIISLTDTGSGISKENTGKVFEPFFSTKGPSGSGLGLSMVYGFVSQSNGLVEVESQNDKGTCISILLPRSSNEVIPSTLSQDDPVKKGNGELILLVEGELALQELVTKMIKMMGYQVIAANNTQEAISYFNNEPNIALVLTDIILF